MDRAPASMVAGTARDLAMGITRPGEHHDAFRYVAPPGPPRIHPGDEAPVPPPASSAPVAPPVAAPAPVPTVGGPQSLMVPIGGETFDPTRMTPVEAMTHVPALRAASRPAAESAPPKAAPAKAKAKADSPGGRTRKTSPAPKAAST